MNAVPQTELNSFALSIPFDLYYQRVTEIPTFPGFIYVSLTKRIEKERSSQFLRCELLEQHIRLLPCMCQTRYGRQGGPEINTAY